MALQTGVGFSKILIIAGAGYTGTILLQNGKLSELIGQLQSLVKGWEKSGDQSDDSEYADAIAAQVRRLANEVRQLTTSRPITVLNGSNGQMGNLSSLVVPAATLGALGYGYMWWKGLSFSDLMYVTKRNMEKAVTDLTKKLQHASDVIADAKKHLTQRIQNLDDKMLKQNELARSIKDDVAGVRSTITDFSDELGRLHQSVGSLDERLIALNRSQDFANYGLAYLIDFVNGNPRKMPEFLPEQRKLPGRSPGLLKYSGTPNVKGLIDIVDTLSGGLDRSASDASVLDGMNKPEQLQKPLLRAGTTRY